MKKPISDIVTFDAITRSLLQKNPLGCTSYRNVRRHYQPMVKIRERYTAKFVYEDAAGKRIGNGQETYHSVEGYQYGIAAVISNMANVAAHKGKVRHIPASDLFSVIFRCHDPGGENYFVSLSRDRVIVASFEDDAILQRVSRWTDTVPELG
jgi:hypothetical protein